MSNVNIVAISGNLTNNAELRNTANTSVLTFSVAFNKSTKKGETWEEHTSFFDCKMFGKSAEAMAEKLTRGVHVTVSGQLYQSRWQQDGQNRSRVEILVDRVDVAKAGGEKQPSGSIYDGEDIPF